MSDYEDPLKAALDHLRHERADLKQRLATLQAEVREVEQQLKLTSQGIDSINKLRSKDAAAVEADTESDPTERTVPGLSARDHERSAAAQADEHGDPTLDRLRQLQGSISQAGAVRACLLAAGGSPLSPREVAAQLRDLGWDAEQVSDHRIGSTLAGLKRTGHVESQGRAAWKLNEDGAERAKRDLGLDQSVL